MSRQAIATLIVALVLVAVALGWWSSKSSAEAEREALSAKNQLAVELAEQSTKSTDDAEQIGRQAAQAQAAVEKEIAALEAELENLDPKLDSVVYLERALALIRVRCQLTGTGHAIAPPRCIEPLGPIAQQLNDPMTEATSAGPDTPEETATPAPGSMWSPQHIELKEMIVRQFADTDSAVVKVALMRLFGMKLNADRGARENMNRLLLQTEGSLARAASEVRFGLGQDVDDSTVEIARNTLLQGHASATEPACHYLSRRQFRDRDGHVEWIQQQIMDTSPRIRVRICLFDVLVRLEAKNELAALAQWASEEATVAPALKRKIEELEQP